MYVFVCRHYNDVCVIFSATCFTAGLVEAAKLRQDHQLLMHIVNEDCVAAEVHYHKLCHQQYLRTPK